MDYTRDLTQEESFCAVLHEVLGEDLFVRQVLFSKLTGHSPGKGLRVRHRDRRHRIEGKAVEFDLFLYDRQLRVLLVIELKGVGGHELPGQTHDIAEATEAHYPNWERVHVYATPEGAQPANRTDFQAMSLDELVGHLEAIPSTNAPESLRRFIEDYHADYHIPETAKKRRARQALVRAQAKPLENLCHRLLAEHGLDSEFTIERERSYHRDLAEVRVVRRGGQWAGFHFACMVRLRRDGELVMDARLAKHGRRNVAALRGMREYLDGHPIPGWPPPAVTLHDTFSGGQLRLVSYTGRPHRAEDLEGYFRSAFEEVLVPLRPRINGFLAEALGVPPVDS